MTVPIAHDLTIGYIWCMHMQALFSLPMLPMQLRTSVWGYVYSPNKLKLPLKLSKNPFTFE